MLIFDLSSEKAIGGNSMKCDVDGPRRFGMKSRHLNRAAGQLLRDVL